MYKLKFNSRGFIITLLDTVTGYKISVYADLASWKDVIPYATGLLRLKQYSNCGLYQITRCMIYE